MVSEVFYVVMNNEGASYHTKMADELQIEAHRPSQKWPVNSRLRLTHHPLSYLSLILPSIFKATGQCR